ncbi:MAG: 6-phosphogluconolactonase [Pseudomonadota bacterium]
MLRRYDTRQDLMTGLAEEVCRQLKRTIQERGRAFLSVPGGSTPRPFFESLRVMSLDWSEVTICLNDERMVPETSERSNAAMIKAHLMQDDAIAASFLDLLEAPNDLLSHLPIDILVTGMGADMHTASIFPDSPQLLDVLNPNAPAVVTVSTPTGGEDRITLSAPILKAARNKHVLIVGPNKLAAYEKSLMFKTPSEAPIRVVLEADPPAVVHYAE